MEELRVEVDERERERESHEEAGEGRLKWAGHV